MENDSIRASGSNTLIDIWVEGKLRAICVTRPAIETFLGPKAPAEMTEDDRCEFVRTHLPQVVAAVRAKLRGDSAADSVVIDSGQLGPVADRRKGERRKTDRRKSAKSADALPHGERRRSQRRGGERRKSPPRADA
jgi:hypothetical protein